MNPAPFLWLCVASAAAGRCHGSASLRAGRSGEQPLRSPACSADSQHLCRRSDAEATSLASRAASWILPARWLPSAAPSRQPRSFTLQMGEGKMQEEQVEQSEASKLNLALSGRVGFVAGILKSRFSQGSLGGSVGGASTFRSGHDLAVREPELHVRLAAVRTELLQILCPPLSLPHPCLHAVSLKNRLKKNI